MKWRVVRSLDTLRTQVNRLAPRRSKGSDGTVGDTSHARRKSGHNPDGSGLVHAWDVTHDAPGGCDAHALADELLAGQDPRLRYIISRRRIGSGPRGPSPGKWRPYRGSNPHDKHAHVEVWPGARADDAGPWRLGRTPTPKPTPTPAPVQEDDMAQADRDEIVQRLTADLLRVGLPPLRLVRSVDPGHRMAAVGPGYYRHLSPEEADAFTAAGLVPGSSDDVNDAQLGTLAAALGGTS